MKMLTAVVASTSLFVACFGQAGQTGRYPDKYNLIDADPSCRYDIPDDVCCVSDRSAQCPNIYDGPGDEDVMAIHPNIFERVEFLTRNMARLYPSFYIDSEWGFSGSYAGSCDQPSTTPTEPFYFMSEATQAGRWNSFSGATTYSGCDRGDECDQQQTSHYTCCDYCEYNTWGQCGYKYRTKGMVQLLFSSNSWNDVGSEGIWCCNTAYSTSSSHCGMVFNYEYEHMGIGYYPSGSTTMVGIKDTDDWEDHVFPHGTHFDWDDSEYTFLTQFYGGKQSSVVYADTVYLLYDGEMTEMDTVVGGDSSTTGTSAFYKLVKSNTQSCEPYAFVAKDTNGNWWRLPEDENYYFSTVSMPDDLVDNSASCNENHYYYTGSKWVANGADGLTNSKDTSSGCVGCSKIDALETAYADKDSSSKMECDGSICDCGSMYACSSSDFDDSDSFYIDINGYKGAAGDGDNGDVTIIVNQPGTWYSKIHGGYGAYETTFTSTDGNLAAYATGAVMDSTVNGLSTLHLDGSNGGANSVITMTSSGGDINCYGDRACYKATISNAEDLRGKGAFSLSQATINSNGIGTIDALFSGYMAGYEATFNCESGDTCNIDCYGNGCFGLILNCQGSCNVDCDESSGSSCPVYSSNDVEDISSAYSALNFDSTTIFVNNMDECESSSSRLYDDIDTRAELNSDVLVSSGYLCCSADYGCGGAYTITSSGNGEDIVCDGEYACYGRVRTISTENSNNNGNIYCSASDACSDTEITSNGNGIIYCGGLYACLWNVLSNADSLYCSSSGNDQTNREAACYYTEVASVKNIYVTAPYGIGASEIYSNGIGEMNVYLAAYRAGYSTKIYCNNGGDECKIYCLTEGSCSYTSLYICSSGATYSTVCDDDKTGCPTVYSGNYCDTFAARTDGDSSSSSSSSSSSDSDDDNMETVVIALGVVCVVLLIALIGSIVYYRRKIENNENEDPQRYALMNN